MFKELSVKTFSVGGSLRNEILGLEAKDFDFVVHNTTEEEFVSIFPEAKRVGNHFPVYLLKDREGNEHEVALARVEQSTGTAYQDFEFVAGVSIEEDLGRRDFSMNSLAKNVVTGQVVDPFNGTQDIKQRIIRTINDKFVKEDPLRVFRLARFAAEFDFNIDKKTIEIVKRDKEYVKNVLPDRIYAELKKNYERASQPSIFFRVLYHLDVLKYHFPYFNVAASIPAGPAKYHHDRSVFEHLLDAFDNAKRKGHSFDVAIASLHHDLGKILTKKDLLPKHHAHENRGIKLVEFIEKHHRFTAKQIELMKVSGKQHMKFHVLEKIKSPVKLVRFYKAIRNHVDAVIQVADNDHELNENQIKILNDLKRTFKETVIDIPVEIKQKGREAIVAFVEQRYTAKYKEISK